MFDENLGCGCSHNGNSITHQCEAHQCLAIATRQRDAMPIGSPDRQDLGRIVTLIQGWIDSSLEQRYDYEEVHVEEDVSPL